MPMANNWHKTAIAYSEPHPIVSVVDWAADGFIHTPRADPLDWFAPVPTELPSGFPKTRAPAGHLVHDRGANDPSEDNRTF